MRPRIRSLEAVLFLVTTLLCAAASSASSSQLLLRDMSDPAAWTVQAGQTLTAGNEPAPESTRSMAWSLNVDSTLSGAAQITHDGLDIPLCDTFMFRVRPGGSCLNVALTDGDGTIVFASFTALAVGAWQQLKFPLTPESREEIASEQAPVPQMMAPGKDGEFGRIQKVTLDIDYRAEELQDAESLTYLFGDFRVRLVDSPELRDLLQTAYKRVNEKLDKAQEKLDALDAAIQAADAAGLDTAFAQAVSVVATHTIHWAQMDADYALENNAPIFVADAERQADYLLSSIPRAFEQLQKVIAEGTAAPPAADMTKIRPRKGGFYADERPVIITGLQSPFLDYEELRRGGYNGVSQREFGLASILAEDGGINADGIKTAVGYAHEAAAENLCLNLLMTLHSLPDWVYEKHPDIDPDGFRRSRNPFMPWNVDSPNFRKLVETFINAALPELAQCSNIAGYDLVNQLWYAVHNDYPAGDWHEFLRKRYFDIGQLNKAWGTQFISFDEPAAELDSPAARKDFADFNAERVARFLQWESGLIHRYDTDTPCYATVPGARTEVIGADKALLAEALDAQGADCSPHPVFTADGVEPDFWTQSIILDLYRSLQNKPIIDTYHVACGVPYDAVHRISGDFVRTMLWQGALHGRDAAYIWSGQRRGACDWVPYEDADGGPHGDHLFLTLPWAMDGAARAAIELERYADVIQQFQQQRAEVALLYSGPDVKEYYQALYFLDAPIRFVTDQQVCDGVLEEGEIKLLVAPSRATISNEGLRGVIEFALGGGTVAVGKDAFTRDEYGRPRDLSETPRPEAIKILRTSAEGPALDKPLAKDLDGLFDAARVRRPFRVSTPGVELRAERAGPVWLLYLINFNSKPVQIELQGLREAAVVVNLFDQAEMTPTFTLAPLQPLLLRVQRPGRRGTGRI